MKELARTQGRGTRRMEPRVRDNDGMQMPCFFVMSLDLVECAKAYETKNHSLCEWKMKYYIQITLLVLRLSCSGQKIKKNRDNLKWLIN